MYRLMRPKLVQGVLYARDGKLPALRTTRAFPDPCPYVGPGLLRYALAAPCIWQPASDATTHDTWNVRGAAHQVVMVTTQEGRRVVVDWSVGQFGEMPEGVGLFLRAEDVEEPEMEDV
jgi:hypothetical protein